MGFFQPAGNSPVLTQYLKKESLKEILTEEAGDSINDYMGSIRPVVKNADRKQKNCADRNVSVTILARLACREKNFALLPEDLERDSLNTGKDV